MTSRNFGKSNFQIFFQIKGDDLAVHGLHGGHPPHNRQVMVMVTMTSIAAADYGLVVPVLVAEAAKLLQPAVNSSNKDYNKRIHGGIVIIA